METAHLQRSMSKKGCAPDNSACKGFFGQVKNEIFYGLSWSGSSVEKFIHTIETTWFGIEKSTSKIHLAV
jgi:transposase InsO family protein